MIILDADVVSELMRPEPAPQVATWAVNEPGSQSPASTH